MRRCPVIGAKRSCSFLRFLTPLSAQEAETSPMTGEEFDSYSFAVLSHSA